MAKFWLIVLLIIHVLILSQLKFTAWPEMLSYPYLHANGFEFYQNLVMPYPPGLPLLLEGSFRLLGFSVQTLKLTTWLLILLTDVILYWLIKKLTTQALAVLMLSVYVILQSFLDGNQLWFDLAIVAPLLTALVFYKSWIDTHQAKLLIGVGFFLALTVMLKQTAIVYLLVFIAFSLWFYRQKFLSQLKFFILGGLMVGLPFLIYLMLSHNLEQFWRWSFYYPLTEWSKFPDYVDYQISRREMIILGLLLLPLVAWFFSKINLKREPMLALSLLMLAMTLVATYPRLSYFHLQPAIALTVVVVSQLLIKLDKGWWRAYQGVLTLVVLAVVSLVGKYQFGPEIRFFSHEDQKIAQVINQEVPEGEPVFLMNLHSAIYVWADRLPPKPWIDHFGWYQEIPGVQEQVIAGLKQEEPVKVFRHPPAQGRWWQLGVYEPQQILSYLFKNYHLQDKTQEGVEIWVRN